MVHRPVKCACLYCGAKIEGECHTTACTDTICDDGCYGCQEKFGAISEMLLDRAKFRFGYEVRPGLPQEEGGFYMTYAGERVLNEIFKEDFPLYDGKCNSYDVYAGKAGLSCE